MAECADVVAVSAAILQRAGIPAIAQGFWTEDSERSVLPTGLSVLGSLGPRRTCFADGAGAEQLKFAVAAREENRYHTLDEREVASSLLSRGPGPPRRRSKYVVVEFDGAIFRLHKSGASGCWMGRRREFRNCQKFQASPISPSTPMFADFAGRGGELEDLAGDTSPALSGDGEALVVGSSYLSWDIPANQAGSQDMEGDE